MHYLFWPSMFVGAVILIVIAVSVTTNIPVTDEEILDCLDHTIWKSGLHLKDELNEKKRDQVRPWRDVGGAIYVQLRNLEEQGYIESCWIQLAWHGHTRERRGYRLTNAGTRRRHELDQQAPVDNLFGDLLPNRT